MSKKQESNRSTEACALTSPEFYWSNNGEVSMPLVNTGRSVSKGKFILPLSASLLVATQAYGLGLDELKVNSYLGQPLNATVPLSLNANEKASSNCFQVVRTANNSGLPNIARARTQLVQSGNAYSLNITSQERIIEPISEITVTTNCSNLPRIERTYMVMLDPSTSLQTYQQPSFADNASSISSQNTTFAAPERRAYQPAYTQPRFVAPTSPIQQGTTYTVTFGESLTEIAARVSGRERGSLWRMAAAIHASNPGAFLNGNPDHLEVGSRISIPDISSGFILSERQAQATLTNPVYVANNQTPVQAISTVTVPATSTTEPVAMETTQSADNETQATSTSAAAPVLVSTVLPTLNLSSSLSSESMQRVQARARGQILTEFIPDNQDLFESPDEENSIVTEAVLTANRESDTPVAEGAVQSAENTATIPPVSTLTDTESSSGSWTTLLGWLLGLVALGLATWKLFLPWLRRRLRIWNIRRHRAHIEKRRYRDRQMDRRKLIEETGSVRALVIPANEEPVLSPVDDTIDSSTGLFEAPDIAAKSEPAKKPKPVEPSDIASTGVMRTIRLDNDEEIDLDRPATGPRKATVAKSVYDVEMIDDTGELASLTTAFPELEAELNARIGEDVMDEAREANETRITEVVETIEVDLDSLEFESNIGDTGTLGSSTAKLAPEIDIDFDATDLVGATQTLRINSDDLDLGLPGLVDDESTPDFESLARDEDFSKTKVFNEEIFNDDMIDASELTQTLSTESIKADESTRVAEVLIDEDGLTPEDFGVSMDELSNDREDYGYLETDASIETEALNIAFDELEEMGLDDDNIIPFNPKKKKKKSA